MNVSLKKGKNTESARNEQRKNIARAFFTAQEYRQSSIVCGLHAPPLADDGYFLSKHKTLNIRRLHEADNR
jgi:hypothetical protein